MMVGLFGDLPYHRIDLCVGPKRLAPGSSASFGRRPALTVARWSLRLLGVDFRPRASRFARAAMTAFSSARIETVNSIWKRPDVSEQVSVMSPNGTRGPAICLGAMRSPRAINGSRQAMMENRGGPERAQNAPDSPWVGAVGPGKWRARKDSNLQPPDS